MTGSLGRFLFAVFVLLLLQSSASCAEKQVLPTFVREGMAQVSRGGEVQISLEAIPVYGNPIAFGIQSSPLHGSLSDPVNTSDHTAVVTYRHDGSRTALLDEFQFRGQAPGRSKSSSARVFISVIPPPVNLLIEPCQIDFSGVILNGKKQTNVEISNLGGIKAVGRIILPKGFFAPDGDSFVLGEGERMKMNLEFSPMEEKDYAVQAVSLPQYKGGILDLKGRGLPRFHVERKDPLTCTVTNLSDEPVTLSLSGDPGWIMPRETVIPPHSHKDFSFQQSEGEGDIGLASHSSVVHVSDGLSATNFELPPPQSFIPLTLTPLTPADFGSVPAGVPLTVKFSILNRTEMGKSVHWIATSSSGGGMENRDVLELKGGESKDLNFVWQPAIPGKATLKISVEEGIKTTHELLWQANIVPATPPPSTVQTVSNDAMIPEADAPAPNLQIMAIPPIEGLLWKVKTLWNGKSELELRWDGKNGDNLQVKLEERFLKMSMGVGSFQERGETSSLPLQIQSIPLEPSVCRTDGDVEVRQFQSLQPGWHQVVLSKCSKEGGLVAQSQLQVFIPAPKSWLSLARIPIGVLFLILLIVFLWKQRTGNR